MSRQSASPKGPTEISSLSAIEHLLTHRPHRVKVIFVQAAANNNNPRLANIYKLAKAAGVPIDASPRQKGTGAGAEPVRAYIENFEYTDLTTLRKKASETPRALVLALDHLQDPQNLGALCRTADGMGVLGVVIPKDRSVSVSPGVYHASVGAVETTPVVLATNLSDALKKLKEDGFWIVGTTLSPEARPLQETPDFDKVVVVLGTELEGMSSGIEKACDWHVRIPLSGKVQSLNVSVAGAILMHHFRRDVAPSPK